MSAARRHEDHATFVPLRFDDAFVRGAVTVRQYALGAHLARLCYGVRITSAGIATVRLVSLAELFEVSDDTIRRDLRALEREWIALEKDSSARAWLIGLTGLASPPRSPADVRSEFRTSSAPEGPPVRSKTSAETSAELEAETSASLDVEPASAELEPPHESPHELEPSEGPGPGPGPRPRPDHSTAVEQGLSSADQELIARLGPECFGSQKVRPPAGEAATLADVEALIAEGVLIERAP